jgi:hypothetical protein
MISGEHETSSLKNLVIFCKDTHKGSVTLPEPDFNTSA